MKKIICIFVLILLDVALVAWAHFPTGWSESKLNDSSDLVAVGIPLATKDMPGKSSLGLGSLEQFQSVETDFLVVKILKGQINTNHLGVLHYRDVADTNGPSREILLQRFNGVKKDEYSVYELSRPGGPLFIRFPPDKTNQYVLYLKKGGGNYFTPIAGQLFSFESFRRLPTERNFSITNQ